MRLAGVRRLRLSWRSVRLLSDVMTGRGLASEVRVRVKVTLATICGRLYRRVRRIKCVLYLKNIDPKRNGEKIMIDPANQGTTRSTSYDCCHINSGNLNPNGAKQDFG